MEKVTVEQLLTKDIHGKVVCFPTDTVYGVGAIFDDLEAIKKIYEMKNRDYSKPLAILTSKKNLEKYVYLEENAKKLMEYWPGPLTIIFQKKDTIADVLTSSKKTVAFRMPNNELTLQILDNFGLMATTSVNISGEQPLNNVEEIAKKFSNYIDYLVIDECKLSCVPSTIVDVSNNEIKIVRKGSIEITALI